ncbi:ATP-binding protein, partial [Nocardioides sp.]|uniref:sensor histidine kinase n=1 Tax=Nocardioides sp. TaxID=35761 RepID=UPI00273588C1
MVRPRLTLASQFLALQLAIIVVVLVAVTGVSLAQSDVTFRQAESMRMRAIAETGASMLVVREALVEGSGRGILPPTAEGLRSLSGADHVIVTDVDLEILTASDPRLLETTLDIGESGVLRGRAWTGVSEIGGQRFVSAHVPVIAGGEVVGVVAAGRVYPGIGSRLATAAPNLPVYLGVAGVLGILGSLLLARRVKRQTLGLEPREITRLVEHREAMLHGIKEGVIGLDPDHRVTLVNDAATDLLGLSADTAGQRLEDLDIDPQLYSVLVDTTSTGDRVVPIGDRVVTLNRMPLIQRDLPTGSVTTMRDRTDLLRLQEELDVSRTTTGALRAQAHEFSNRLHVISGLLELDEYDETRRYVQRISGAHAQLSADVAARVGDSAVAALLIAKVSLAHEQDAELRVAPRTELGPLGDQVSADLVMVLGNLLDNALDAVRGQVGERVVQVCATEDAEGILLQVSDTGPGVPAELREKVFQQGFSTKDDGRPGGRGLGLDLVRVVCARRGGSVRIEPEAQGS